MLEKTKKNFATGVARVKWMAGFLAERAKTETSLAKTSFEKNRIQGNIDELYRVIGKRVAALQDSGGAEVVNDAAVQQSLTEVRALEEKLRDLARQGDSASDSPA
jgi:hypothetical protein